MNDETSALLKTRLPLERMAAIGRGRAPAYARAKPFPHIVLDDFFDPWVLDRVLGEFPGPGDINWHHWKDYFEKKLSSRDESQLGPFTRTLFHDLNSQPFVSFLEELTGIQGLIPDPHLEGGGLHQIVPGGKLGIHCDFNKSLKLKLDRRLNLLIYLNRDWRDEWGSHLELWNREMQRCVVKVAPVFNRVVLFSTTDFSYHGHPGVLTCPEGRTRKSLALYYYSNGRPKEEVSGGHSTLFRLRPGEKEPLSLRLIGQKLLPPIAFDIHRWITKAN